MIDKVLGVLVEKLDPWISVRGRVITVREDSCIGDVKGEEV